MQLSAFRHGVISDGPDIFIIGGKECGVGPRNPHVYLMDAEAPTAVEQINTVDGRIDHKLEALRNVWCLKGFFRFFSRSSEQLPLRRLRHRNPAGDHGTRNNGKILRTGASKKS